MGRSRKRSKNQLDGVLVLDKPNGPTSTKCLNTIKKSFDQGKIGHAGTLDPMATGVLLVLLGQATKMASYLTDGKKTYTGELQLGLTTDTYDIEGVVTEEKSIDHISASDVEQDILDWKKLTQQEVPPVSAAKHQGKPLYELARKGKEVPVKIKEIEIFASEILETELPRVRFRVTVSAGTYIRSLVHSLGIRLGTGATLTSLTREHCHPFGLDSATGLDDLLADPDQFRRKVIPLREALPHWPALSLDDKQAKLVKNGGWLPVDEVPADSVAAPGDRAMLVDREDTPLALVEATEKDGRLSWSILRGLWL